jgi:glycosyltransferase involved in cell wall biosynthesis
VIHAIRTEGFGMVVVEAMAAGVPVIASDVPACREVLDGGRCGLLVPVGDAPALADAIRPVLDDRALRMRLVQAASERVRSHYHVKRMAAGYAELFLAWSAPPGRAVAIGENQTGLGAVRGCIAK